MILLDMEMLQSAEETGGKIGDPTPYETVGMTFFKCTFMKSGSIKNGFHVPYGVFELAVKTSSSQESVSSTSVPASLPSAAEPGLFKWNRSSECTI